jgi:hypothetical protein
MDLLLQDLRHAARGLWRQPGFSLTAILTLALGIGATTAIFSVVNAVVLRPLPYVEPERLVAIMNYWTRSGLRGATVSAPDFFDWQQQSRSIGGMSYYIGGEVSVATEGAADYASVIRVSPGFFDVFKVEAQIGRLLTADEQRPGGPASVVITDAFWRRQFAASRSAIGATLRFNQRPHAIVGVLPAGFRSPNAPMSTPQTRHGSPPRRARRTTTAWWRGSRTASPWRRHAWSSLRSASGSSWNTDRAMTAKRSSSCRCRKRSSATIA